MARRELGAVANRLFEGFLAPLVLGGAVTPGRPIGARAALAMGAERVVADSMLLATVQAARTRHARRLVPVDRVPPPTEAEWALGAALHDIVQAAHPGFDAPLRRGGPPRLLDLAEATLARVRTPRSVGEALGRHTWFSRVFELTRSDTVVRWWVGSRRFLGETPPARLSAWPELRRVHVETTARAVMNLPAAGGAVDPSRFAGAIAGLLAQTPLTDLATCQRDSPAFAWSATTLGLVATAPGRVLALRALGLGPRADVDAGLGRATRALLDARAFREAGPALDLLAERALSDAESARADGAPGHRGRRGDAWWEGAAAARPADPGPDDAAYARCLGALVACERIRAGREPFGEDERERILAHLTPAATSPAAIAVKSAMAEVTSLC